MGDKNIEALQTAITDIIRDSGGKIGREALQQTVNSGERAKDFLALGPTPRDERLGQLLGGIAERGLIGLTLEGQIYLTNQAVDAA